MAKLEARMTRRAALRPIDIHARLGIACVLAVILLMIFDFSFRKDPVSVREFKAEPRAAVNEEISRGNKNKREIMLTLDGGADPVSGEAILDTLKRFDIKGSFLLTGGFVEQNPDLVRRMVKDGHEIFNHTYSHAHLTALSDEEITMELERMEASLRQVANVSPRPYYRAPYGERDSRVNEVAFKNGYQSLYWTIDAEDWKETEGITAEEVKENILSNLEPGSIVLMHIGDKITGDVLGDLLVAIQSKGYKVIPVSEGI